MQDSLTQRIIIYAPEHTYTEVANILAINGRQNIGQGLRNLFDTDLIKVLPHTISQTNIASEIVQKYKGVSFYDAVYHAMAIIYAGTLITADEKYYKKTKALGHSMLLQDYPV